MIEVPAAALSSPRFLRHFDFVSIGTNDLIQYTLAIDRADDAVSHLYDPWHPAVLGLLTSTIECANAAGKAVSVCGEMAGDPAFTELLLAMGLRSFSMHPAQIAVDQAARAARRHATTGWLHCSDVLAADTPQIEAASRLWHSRALSGICTAVTAARTLRIDLGRALRSAKRCATVMGCAHEKAGAAKTERQSRCIKGRREKANEA